MVTCSDPHRSPVNAWRAGSTRVWIAAATTDKTTSTRKKEKKKTDVRSSSGRIPAQHLLARHTALSSSSRTQNPDRRTGRAPILVFHRRTCRSAHKDHDSAQGGRIRTTRSATAHRRREGSRRPSLYGATARLWIWLAGWWNGQEDVRSGRALIISWRLLDRCNPECMGSIPLVPDAVRPWVSVYALLAGNLRARARGLCDSVQV